MSKRNWKKKLKLNTSDQLFCQSLKSNKLTQSYITSKFYICIVELYSLLSVYLFSFHTFVRDSWWSVVSAVGFEEIKLLCPCHQCTFVF